MLTTPEIHKAIKKAADGGQWITTKHANLRMIQRGFTAPDVERILRGGVHNPALDEFKDGSWRYRIHGNTIDGRNLDLAVVIENLVVVVTVIGR